MEEEHKRSIQVSDADSSKKQKIDEPEENPFTLVGEAAEAVDQLDSDTEQEYGEDGIRKTGATDAEGHPVQEVESMCVNCEKNGVTRMLFTMIPHFREVIIMSFECPHCGLKNSEIQPAAQIQEKGSKYLLKVTTKEDLNRQVVKSESCTCKFGELDIEIPPKRGQLTTVEGLLQQIHSDLSSDQPMRKQVDPDAYAKIEEFLQKVQNVLDGKTLPITLSVDDPSGNSWVEFVPGEPGHKWSHVEYFRTMDQNIQLGIHAPGAEGNNGPEALVTEDDRERNPSSAPMLSDETEIENIHGEVQTFHATCPSCYSPCPTHMKVVNIPHFKDVIIMSTACDECGYKSNEVKTGGAVPAQGRKIVLKIDDPDDLARDVLKSESCGIQIPELDLDLTPGTLGGRFTTLEGLLKQVYDELKSRVFTETSDSMDPETYNRWNNFLARLQSAFTGQIEFTVIMEDPLAGSYIQNVYAPDDDPNMTITDYDRTDEQNEDLGLNDMVVDN